MAIRNIRMAGDEILRKRSREVEEITDKIKILIEDMIETLHANNGYGLAAVQVGVLKRIVVIDLYDGDPPIILINPEIKKEKGEQIVDEGCLSFPNQFAKVKRPEEITVVALNEKGEKIKLVGKGLLAQAIAHETDHLNGELFTDKMLDGTMEVLTPEKGK